MLYDRLSRAGHNRRSAVLDTVLAQQRRMAYGREIDPVRRVNVEWTSTLIAELVNHVGDAVSAFLGRCWYREKFLPLFQSIEAVRAESPLNPEAVAELLRARGMHIGGVA